MTTTETETTDLAALQERLRRAEDACQLLGRVVTGQARAMEAARIEMLQGSTHKAMQWILNSLPDVDDNDPEDQWDGFETAQEWFDRTDERRAKP